MQAPTYITSACAVISPAKQWYRAWESLLIHCLQNTFPLQPILIVSIALYVGHHSLQLPHPKTLPIYNTQYFMELL